MIENNKSIPIYLRTFAWIVMLLGIIGSLYFMFNTGRNQNSIVLIALFTAWLLSPFAGLFVATKISARWPLAVRSSIYWLMIGLTFASLVAYSGVLMPTGTKPAFIFLVAPLASWIIILIVILITRKLFDINNQHNQG